MSNVQGLENTDDEPSEAIKKAAESVDYISDVLPDEDVDEENGEE
jgi:hypothetical protein